MGEDASVFQAVSGTELVVLRFKMTGKSKEAQLRRVLAKYFDEIHGIYSGGDFREESFYPALKRLIEECSELVHSRSKTNVLVLPRRTEAGIPDFRVGKNENVFDIQQGVAIALFVKLPSKTKG